MATSSRPQTNGVIHLPASQTSGSAPKPVTASKPPTPKLKVIIRRLAPCLTEAEFTSILGEEWNLGRGRVDWFLYKPGKDSKDPSKPSRPSRAYLHLTSESYLLELSEAVRGSVFEDAQNTTNSPCLVGPPTVEFAPYGRTPGGRRRVDARAGTIDQDPEFMAFLEGLANPATTKENTDAMAESTLKPEKVTTTPLVQYLKDKKANKNKEAAAKSAKKSDGQSSKGKSPEKSSNPEDVKKKGKDVKVDRAVEKAAKEAVKILNREAALKTSGPSESSGSENIKTPKLDLGKVPSRQRGTIIAAHIRMLQRDLGLSPAQAHRQVRRDTADAQKAQRAAAAAEKTSDETKGSPSQTTSTPTTPTAPKASLQSSNRKPRGKAAAAIQADTTQTPSAPAGPSTPMVLLRKPEASKPDTAQNTPANAPTTNSKPPATSASRKQPAIPTPSEGATQAFVKHANPSQGVTEALLKEAMEKFGAVSTVEIDKRKGFAYVDFVDTEGLRKAMAANPISVAQGTVQVMQRKGTALAPEKKPHQAPHAPRGGGGSGGGRGGRGGTVGRRAGRGRGGGNTGPSTEASRASSSAPTGPAK